MPRDYKGRPRNIPSQNPDRKIPYFPGVQADIEQFAKMRVPLPHGYAPSGAFAVATYDSRLINTVDFFKSIGITSGSATTPSKGGMTGNMPAGQTSASVTWTVPEGFTAVLRSWQIGMTYLSPLENGTTEIIFVQGSSGVNYQIDFTLNGSSLEEMTQIENEDFPFGPLSGDAFIIADGGETIGVNCNRINFNNGYTGTVRMDRFDVKFYGQLILNPGVTPIFAPLNRAAIPVKTGAFADALKE